VNIDDLGPEALAGLRALLASHDAAQAQEAAPAPEQDWGLGGILHLILDHVHVREDLRARAHAAVDALAEATGEVADTVDSTVTAPEGA
jgi:hypothetical protein